MKTLQFFLVLFSFGLLQAQQFELINNTWYLEKMIGINGVVTPAPNNTEVSSVTAHFNQNYMQTDVVTTFDCFIFPGSSPPITNTTINYDEYLYAPNYPNCIIPSNCVFQNNYFFFFGYGFPMSYQITTENNYLKLILTNNSGNQAIFHSQYLSTNEIKKDQFIIFPNPVHDILNISTKTSNLKVQLFDMRGKIIFNRDIYKTGAHFELNIKHVPTGMYVIKLMSNNDEILYSQKIIKK